MNPLFALFAFVFGALGFMVSFLFEAALYTVVGMIPHAVTGGYFPQWQLWPVAVTISETADYCEICRNSQENGTACILNPCDIHGVAPDASFLLQSPVVNWFIGGGSQCPVGSNTIAKDGIVGIDSYASITGVVPGYQLNIESDDGNRGACVDLPQEQCEKVGGLYCDHRSSTSWRWKGSIYATARWSGSPSQAPLS